MVHGGCFRLGCVRDGQDDVEVVIEAAVGFREAGGDGGRLAEE